MQSTLESFEFRNQIPRLSRVLTGAEETLQQLAAARGKQDPPYGKGWQGDAHFLAR